MLKISEQSQLIEFLKNYKSATTAKLVTKTVVKMNVNDVATRTKKHNFGTVYKVSVIEADINFDYETKVNDQRFLEGKDQDFKASAPKWGTAISKSLSENNGQFYLKANPKKSLYKSSYENEAGEKIDYKDIEPWIPVKKETLTEGGQGTDKEVVFRAYKLDSIIHLSIENVLSYTE